MTTDSANDSFSLGVTYWPRRAGPLFWQRYDRGAVRDELAHIAALGCDTVRLCLVWEDFQPAPERIGSRAMRYLEHVLDAAHAASLRVVLTLFPATILSALQLPSWANGPDIIGALRRASHRGTLLIVRPSGLVPVLVGGRYRPVQSGDLFSEPLVVEAQRYLVREIGGYFGAHPSIWAWQLGEGFERIHRPASDTVALQWYATLGDELRRVVPRALLMGAVSVPGLKRRSGPRPEHVAQCCTLVGVVADPPETPVEGQTRHSDAAAYLHALVAGLAGRRTIVASVGMPLAGPGEPAGCIDDDLYGRTLTLYHATADEQGTFVDSVLDRLYREGASGVWLASYADYPEELWRIPPLDRTRRYRAMGLVDATGREKPAALALRDAARRIRDASAARPLPPALDSERYWSDPERMFRDLWREFKAYS